MNVYVLLLIGAPVVILAILLLLVALPAGEKASPPRREPEVVVAPAPKFKPDPFPSVLELLARSLRGGMNFERALARVGAEAEQPLADEFARCATQIKLGLPVRMALEHLANRLPECDIPALASAVNVVQAGGGNLPALLERLAESVRVRQPKPAPVAPPVVLAAPPVEPAMPPSSILPALGRVLLLPIVVVVPVAVTACFVWHPQVMSALVHHPAGPWIAGAVVSAEILGLLGAYRVLRLES